MRYFLLSVVILLSASCASKGLQQKSLRFTEPVAVTTEVNLVFDKKFESKTPQNFRKNEELKISGSGTFSEPAAKFIAKVSEVVLVVDLRQESHGLINSKPVTWESDRDWANANMGVEQVIQREKRYLSEVRIGSKIQGSKVSSIETEESLIRSLGQSYVRLAVTNHVRPSNSQVDRFIEAVRNMPATSWIHIHCRTGKGRTTTFMLMYDMLRSAWNTSYDVILERNLKLSSDFELVALSPEGDWQRPYQEDTIAFLKEFYNYAKAHPNGEGLWWSGWAN